MQICNNKMSAILSTLWNLDQISNGSTIWKSDPKKSGFQVNLVFGCPVLGSLMYILICDMDVTECPCWSLQVRTFPKNYVWRKNCDNVAWWISLSLGDSYPKIEIQGRKRPGAVTKGLTFGCSMGRQWKCNLWGSLISRFLLGALSILWLWVQ